MRSLVNPAAAAGFLVLGEMRPVSEALHPVSLELTGKARELADRRAAGGGCGTVTALVLAGDRLPDPNALIAAGADRVLLAQAPAFEAYDAAAQARALAWTVEREKPEVVLAGATTNGRSVLPAAAARLRTGLTADCTGLDLDPETGGLLQTRPAIGGNVMATIRTSAHRPQMATVRPRNFPLPAPDPNRRGTVRILDLPEEARAGSVCPRAFRRAAAGRGIEEEDVLVSGGKGLRRPEGFALLRELARALGGGVGASRAAVEARWIEYPHQVGLSGRVVSPKLYVAAGISGAVQHLAGMQTAGTIVAVNKDPEAPIFRVADLGLCGDLYDLIPRILRRLEE